MVQNISGGCQACNGTGMSGGSSGPTMGGARRRQHHMLQSQHGVDPRQNAVVSSTETVQQQPRVVASGGGMGFRDPSVRLATRDMARSRAMENPSISHWRGNELVMGGSWFSDAFAKVKNEFVNPDSKLRKEIAPKLVDEAVKAARPHVESLGNQLGKQVGVENLGTYADKGLKMLGKGRQGRKMAKMSKKELAAARASGAAYLHGGQYFKGDAPMSVDDMNKHKLAGGSFWDTLKKVGRSVVAPAGNALGALVGMPLAGTFADQGLKLAGYGKTGGAKKGSDGRSARNAIVRKVMAEKGLKMIEASKYVKQHGLY